MDYVLAHPQADGLLGVPLEERKTCGVGACPANDTCGKTSCRAPGSNHFRSGPRRANFGVKTLPPCTMAPTTPGRWHQLRGTVAPRTGLATCGYKPVSKS